MSDPIQTDIISNIEALLKEKQVYGGTFSGIGQHSPIADIKKGVQVLKDLNADTIISVGGGSPIDASKLILHFLEEERGEPVLTHVAIPTTLSAAEYTVSCEILPPSWTLNLNGMLARCGLQG